MDFKSFPDKEALLKRAQSLDSRAVLNVNAHIHTPYSFSSFSSLEEAFDMAKNEKVKILGINDFFVTNGYYEFNELAIKNKIFPLFNIEFIGLIKEAQHKGIRINDPNNPGRVYISGKGLKFPFKFEIELERLVQSVINESQFQIKEMIERVNRWFAGKNINIQLDYSQLKILLAKDLVRERHIAKAIRIEMDRLYLLENESITAYESVFNGKPLKSKISDKAALENEIRSNLLKKGGPAFVEETAASFLDIKLLIEIIHFAGGIPCYPVLLDDNSGSITEFEADYENLAQELTKLEISCIELIPNRNDSEVLMKFVKFFDEKGFIVLFGTEHNTPDMVPLTPIARGNKPLDEELKNISYKGACVVAAHQYLVARGEDGFIEPAQRNELIMLGNAVIDYFFSDYKN